MTDHSPVTVIGAGLSGICCARWLMKHNIDVVVLEAQDGIGGRMRTDRVDGFLLDRGFQVLQTAYPEATAELDYSSLRLHHFEPGALIQTGGRVVEMSDPWRRPFKLLPTAFNCIGTLSDRLKLAKLRWHVTRTPLDRLWQEPETTTEEYLLSNCGLSSDIVDRFLRPWFSGVFLEKKLSTSSRFFKFLFRTFAIGDASLPEHGIGEIPQQLAKDLPASAIRLNAPVESVEPPCVRLSSGETLNSRAIVIAVEGPEASRLTKGMIPTPEARATICFYYAASKPPFDHSLLVLNGDGSGPINNMAVISNVAKSYAPGGQSLISVSVVGGMESDCANQERAVREQLGDWFGRQVESWRLLKSYRIPFALPGQKVRSMGIDASAKGIAEGLFVCGDFCESASIQGAMVSGRKAAEAVMLSLKGKC